MSGVTEPARLAAELEDLEGRLQRLADQFVERAMVGGLDAIELFDRGTVLQRAAFALRTTRSSEIDLRDDAGPRVRRP